MENEAIIEYIKKTEKKYKEEYSEFVQNNALLFYDMACIEINKLIEIQKAINVKTNYGSLDLDSSFGIAQKFFDIHNINVNLKELYDQKTLMFYYDNGQRSQQFFRDNSAPSSYQGYNEERGKFVNIIISNNIMDAFAIVHEITHYMNQPNGTRNMVSDMLTEAVSYSIEFIFAQSLINAKFMIDDAKLFIYNCHMETLQYAYRLAPIYRLLHVYKDSKNIDVTNYNKLIPNGNYEHDIAEFTKYMNEDRNYICDTWTFLGKCISIYLYNEYRKDKNYLEKIIKLNNSINHMNFEYCLKLIDLYDETLSKISKALDENINYIKEF